MLLSGIALGMSGELWVAQAMGNDSNTPSKLSSCFRGLGDWILSLSLSTRSEPGWYYFPLPEPPPKLMVWFGGLLDGLVLSTLDIAGIP